MGAFRLIFILSLGTVLAMCSPDDDSANNHSNLPAEVTSPVNFEPDFLPYSTLSEYNFFEGTMANLEPVAGVIPYELITSLFSDYAIKKRFIWMAHGSSASYNADHKALNFDDGTVLIKNFYYENVLPAGKRRILETRLMYRLNGAWQFAEYVWNEEQTEATLHMNGAYMKVDWLEAEGDQRTVNYRIPSEHECFTCHKVANIALPLGPKPQNLDKDIAYPDGVKNQLAKWAELGYLNGNLPSEINRLVAWDDPSRLTSDRVRSYLDVNCSSCHTQGGHCDYRPLKLAWSESDVKENLGVCVEPDEFINSALLYNIAPGNINRSGLHFRLNTIDEGVRMPLLGRSVVHNEFIALLTEYINSLDDICQ